jgi:hypothetical protein
MKREADLAFFGSSCEPVGAGMPKGLAAFFAVLLLVCSAALPQQLAWGQEPVADANKQPPAWRPQSDASTPQEQSDEINELNSAIEELYQSEVFKRHIVRMTNRCSGIVINIKYGDSSQFTHTDDAGGTFVPRWQNPDAPPGKRQLVGGTIIVDKARLRTLRPNHDYTEFLLEAISHELFHAYQFCFDKPEYVNETHAIGFGEAVARDRGFPVLSETNPEQQTTPKDRRTGMAPKQSNGASGNYNAATPVYGNRSPGRLDFGWSLSFDGVYSLVSSESVFGSGTVVDGREHFGARAPSSLDRFGFAIGAEKPLSFGFVRGAQTYFTTEFSYAGGSGSDSGRAIVGEDSVTTVGLTFLKPDGILGTGVSTSTIGNYLSSTSKVENTWVMGSVGLREVLQPWNEAGLSISVGLAGTVETLGNRYSGTSEIYGPEPPTLLATQDISANTSDSYYGVKLSGGVSVPVTTWLSIGVDAYANPAYHVGRGSISQYTSYGDVYQEIDRSTRGISFSGGIGANVRLALRQNSSVSLSYEHSCLGDVTTVHVPQNPDEQPAFLASERMQRDFFKAELELKF